MLCPRCRLPLDDDRHIIRNCFGATRELFEYRLTQFAGVLLVYLILVGAWLAIVVFHWA